MIMAHLTLLPSNVEPVASTAPVQVSGKQNRESHLININCHEKGNWKRIILNFLVLVFLPRRNRGLSRQNFRGPHPFRAPPPKTGLFVLS